MEDPSKTRVERIAAHLLRAVDEPVHDVVAHKRAMIDLLQFLTIEEAYSVSVRYGRLYEWFQTEGVWRTLAQRWLSPQRYNQVTETFCGRRAGHKYLGGRSGQDPNEIPSITFGS